MDAERNSEPSNASMRTTGRPAISCDEIHDFNDDSDKTAILLRVDHVAQRGDMLSQHTGAAVVATMGKVRYEYNAHSDLPIGSRTLKLSNSSGYLDT